MDFFTRGYSALRGERGQPQSADETIERLADCLETATLLEDRRAGVLSLKGLVRDWPEEVGNKSLPALVKVLHTDYKDADVTKSLLETLTVLCTVHTQSSHDDRGYQFTDYLTEDSRNVTILLDILEEYDFYVRFNTIKLLSVLLINRIQRIQECILTSPMGITRLVDLLDDKRDIIRNESLLLLIALTRNNTEIQKLVTFQATFEKLLAIIEDQEGISGDIVVQDSLSLMHNLLRYNVSDQVYFRETSCIQQIPGLLGYVGDSEADHVPFSYEEWPPQKVANTILVLQLIRILAEPDGVNTPVNQKVMAQSGIMLPIVQLGICSNAPSIVRTEAIYAIAYVIRGNTENQEIFAKTMVASPPKITEGQVDTTVAGLPRPAMVSLIAIAVTADPELQYSYSSRAAATYGIFSCVEGNPDAQLVIAATMKMPPEDNVNAKFSDKPHSAGSLLLEVIENWELSLHDPYKLWFACAILSHIIKDNEQAKSIAGSIVFGEEANGEEPVPLLHHIVAQLLMSVKNPATNSRIHISYLCLLCTWLWDSPESVSLFLLESTHVQFLIQEVQSSAHDPTAQGLAAFLLGITYVHNNDPKTPMDREKLQAIISSRVDQFTSHMTRLRDSPAVKSAPQFLQITVEDEAISNSTKSLPSLLLDSTFVEFFKNTYGKDKQKNIQKSLKRKPSSFKQGKSYAAVTAENTHANHEAIQSYKNTIDQQASQISTFEQQTAELKSALDAKEMFTYIIQQMEEDRLKNALAEMETSLASEKTKNSELASALAAEKSASENMKSKVTELEASIVREKTEMEDLLVCMGEQDLDIKKYRKRLRDLGEVVTDSEEEEE
ncbi:hypothetical protein DFQ28_008174 [Apophysomyces sp. BC1034]|nr:hypothetical protein DFQ30_007139 [Apophysomyces sp. BC1015]KAG0175824.1 hypothetical protein DFQ29_006967 [Apophysomyces sp. BC1021]KAG0186214.1 hypothetical protein DFQ28_008174 [Apophysomyces sp. BC1034]